MSKRLEATFGNLSTEFAGAPMTFWLSCEYSRGTAVKHVTFPNPFRAAIFAASPFVLFDWQIFGNIT
jgi:hypothetical protein